MTKKRPPILPALLVFVCFPLAALETILRATPALSPVPLKNLHALEKIVYPTGVDNLASTLTLPNRSFVFINEDGSRTIFETDGIGFRKNVSPCPGCRTVLVLGDSFTQAVQVNAPDAWVERLEARFRREGRRLQFRNAGFGGIGTWEEAVVFFRFVDRVKPAAVILQFTSNDFRNNMGGWKDPDAALAAVDAPWAPSARSKALSDRPYLYYFARNRRRPLRALADLSFLVERIRFIGAGGALGYRFGKNSFMTLEVEGKRQRFIVEDRLDMPGLAIYRKLYPPEFEYSAAFTERVLARLKRECAARGAAFVVAHLPMREAVHSDVLWPRLPDRGAKWDPNKPSSLLREICKRQDIPLVDALAGFRSRRRDAALFWPGDAHYTQDGNRAAAEILFPELKRSFGDLGSSP